MSSPSSRWRSVSGLGCAEEEEEEEDEEEKEVVDEELSGAVLTSLASCNGRLCKPDAPHT